MKILKISIAMTFFIALNGCLGKINILAKNDAQRISAEGLSKYNVRDISASKSIALFEAQKNVVLKVVRLFLTDSFDEDKGKIENTIIQMPRLYIKKYKIEEASKYGDYYRIKISALVFADKILKSIQSSVPASGLGRMKILIAIKENRAGKEYMSGGAERGLKKGLMKAGNFEFAEAPAQLGKEFFADNVLQGGVARGSGSDILIMGNASANKMETSINTGFYPVRASIKLKAIAVNTGKILCETSLKANTMGTDANETLYNVLVLVGEKAAAEIFPKLKKTLPSKPPMKLKVGGVENYSKLKKFSDFIGSIERVSQVKLVDWENDAAVFDLRTSMSAEEFASFVLRKNIFPISFEKAEKNELIMRFTR